MSDFVRPKVNEGPPPHTCVVGTDGWFCWCGRQLKSVVGITMPRAVEGGRLAAPDTEPEP